MLFLQILIFILFFLRLLLIVLFFWRRRGLSRVFCLFELLQIVFNFIFRHISDLHGHANFAVVLRTIEMSDVCQVYSEAFFADLTVKYFFLLAFLVVLDSARVLLNSNLLLSSNEHALVSADLMGWLWCLLFFMFLHSELFSPPVVSLSYHLFFLFWLRHASIFKYTDN